MNVVDAEVTFHDISLLVPGQLMKDLSEVLADLTENQFLPPLGNEDDVILAIPFSVV